jgi:hypothetical protein
VDNNLKEDIKLNMMNNKVVFKQDFKRMDLIMEVMCKDKDFKQQMKTTKAETQ